MLFIIFTVETCDRNFLTLKYLYVILFVSGGDYIYVIVFMLFSVFLSYQIVLYYIIYNKSKRVISKEIHSKLLFKLDFLNLYIRNVEKILSDSGYPYKMNTYSYIFLKYFLSTFLFIITTIRGLNFFVSLMYFISIFFLPNILIKIFKRNEAIKIISDIDNIVQTLILLLSSKIPLHESLKLSIDVISSARLKKEFEVFVNDYILYNFNMAGAVEKMANKFNSYELNMFLSLLIQIDKDGNILENLEAFEKTLELSYFKYLKYRAAKRLLYVSFSTVLSLVDIILIVLYPIFIQLTNNLSIIFK